MSVTRYQSAEHRVTLTHVYLVVAVSYKQVPENPGLIQVPEADHVLHSADGGRVHRLDPSLRGEPLFLAVIINHLPQLSQFSSQLYTEGARLQLFAL